jgi:hypothetical protein
VNWVVEGEYFLVVFARLTRVGVAPVARHQPLQGKIPEKAY